MSNAISLIPQIQKVDVRLEGDRVVVIENGEMKLNLAAEHADLVADAMKAQCRRREEIKNAPAIALDQALLLRKGIPLGLTSHPKIQAEAAKEAAWNRDLRRYLPGGVKSHEQVGTPAVVRHPPPRREPTP